MCLPGLRKALSGNKETRNVVGLGVRFYCSNLSSLAVAKEDVCKERIRQS